MDVGITLAKSYKQIELDRVINRIKSGNKILILMRGVSGCGKSYLAHYIVKQCTSTNDFGQYIFSADDFFMCNGVYNFNSMRLPEAHHLNQMKCKQALMSGINPVIIDNTNTQMWEMKPYATMAATYNYGVEIVEPHTWWFFNEKELVKRNSHFVSHISIRNMLERYEKNITVKQLLNACGFTPSSSANIDNNLICDNISMDKNNGDHLLHTSAPFETDQAASISNKTDKTTLAEKSTCIDSKLFNCSDSDANDVSIIQAKARDINRNIETSRNQKLPIVNHSDRTADQSCTVNEDDFTKDIDKSLQILCDMFPNIPVDNLLEIFNKCHQNFEWTLEVLLADNNTAYSDQETISNNICHDTNSDVNSNSANVNDNQQNLETNESSNEQKGNVDKTPHKVNSVSNSQVNALNDSDSDYDYLDDNNENNGYMELNLNKDIISQLEVKFPYGPYPKGFQPVIEIPISMAKQLYSLYLESIAQQMDAQRALEDEIIDQDEKLAKELQKKENEGEPHEIEDNLPGEITSNLYKKHVDKWSSSDVTLAEKLSQEKLIESFPSCDSNFLIRLLEQNGNNYKNTVQLLEEFYDLKPCKNTETVNSDQALDQAEESLQTAEFYHSQANKHFKERDRLQSNAHDYYRRGMVGVADFYSQLAREQTKLFNETNDYATAAIYDTFQRFRNYSFIDLHFMHVREALVALDIFIDKVISWLRKGNGACIKLLVITGRGKHSVNGIAQIKPSVMMRLKKRAIKFSPLNPGLLCITVVKNSVPSNELVKRTIN